MAELVGESFVRSDGKELPNGLEPCHEPINTRGLAHGRPLFATGHSGGQVNLGLTMELQCYQFLCVTSSDSNDASINTKRLDVVSPGRAELRKGNSIDARGNKQNGKSWPRAIVLLETTHFRSPGDSAHSYLTHNTTIQP
ncbi:hypothetical protein RRG08_038685 [Elysia crispata]|uniref:Uncharacterized protein n=1 Tax=Elysia crispata TaxID=231223 RepID=A0AAE1DGU1_9GAST|nr:hypothetical protein RRG08_038685 [Elysia crispata]